MSTETLFRVTSPFIEAPPLREGQEIHDLLFSQATVTKIDNAEIITESDVDPEPYIRSFRVFKDVNKNDKVDPNETVLFEYRMKVFVSRDAEYLELAYSKADPAPDDICIFLEDNRGDFFSGKTAKLKVGVNFLNDLQKLEQVSALKQKSLIDALNEYFTDFKLDFTPDEIKELIETGKLENASLTILTGIAQIANASNVLAIGLYEALGGAMTDVADFLRKYITFKPHHWDPDAKIQKDPDDESDDPEMIENPNFKPVLFPFAEQLADSLTAPVKENAGEVVRQFRAELEKKDAEILAGIERFKNGRVPLLLPLLPGVSIPVTLSVEGAANFVSERYETVRPYIFKALDTLAGLIENLDELLERGLNLINAFICGVWNSLAETLIGIFDLLGLLFKAMVQGTAFLAKAKTNVPRLLELIDSFVQYVAAIDFSAVVRELVKQVKELDLATLARIVTPERLTYYVGAFYGFVIEMVIEALLTGGIKNIQSIIARIGSLAENMLGFLQTAIARFTGKSLKNLKDNILELFAKVVAALSKGTDEILRWVREFFAELQAQAAVSVRFGSALSSIDPIITPFLKRILGSRAINRLTKAGLKFGKKDELFVYEYRGVRLGEFKTERDLVPALREVLKKSGDDLIKFLDELYNLKRFGFAKFVVSPRFKGHLEFGHVRVKKLDPQKPRGENIVDEYEYLPGNGLTPESGFSYKISVSGAHMLRNLNNDFIRIFENITTRKLPTGETVKIGKIEFWVEELGQWMAKKDTHTFWPQGWTYKQVEEVIKSSSENIFFNVGNKFRGVSKDGIEVEFYINEITKEIETAYIYFK